jgi:hypothetical protein
MDLSEIEQKIEARAYRSVGEFVYDFALVPFNAQLFNPPGSGAHRDALIVERELGMRLRMLAASGVIEAEDAALLDLGDVTAQNKQPRLQGAASALAALQHQMASYQQYRKPESELKTNDVISESQRPDTKKAPTSGSWLISNLGTPLETIETQEAEPTNPNTKSENTNPDQSRDQASTSQQLARLVASISRALNILKILQMHHSRDATIIPEITEDLQSLLASFERLSQLNANPQYEPNFVKVQEQIQVLCRSTQHTLDAMLQVLTAEPPSDETMLMQLTMLTVRMAGKEKVGLTERLRWYSASVLGLLNHMDGYPSAGRIFQWLGMDEKVRSLLERQEGSPGLQEAT